MEKNKIKLIITFFILAACILAVFLFFAKKMESHSRVKINTLTAETNKKPTIDEYFVDTDVEIIDVRDIDLRRGAYTLSTYIDLYYDPQLTGEIPDFMVNNAQIVDKRLLNRAYTDGKVNDTYLLVTNHSFIPIIYDFPLEAQVLVLDILSKNPFDSYSFKINNVYLGNDVTFDNFTFLKSGGVLQAATMYLPNKGEFDAYLSRAYILIEHESFLIYLRSFNMMLVSVILALASFLSISDNARYGTILGSLLISMGNLNNLYNKIRDGLDLTFMDISWFYYTLIIVSVLIMVSINSRNRYFLDKLDRKIDRFEGNSELTAHQLDLITQKDGLERRAKIIDKYAVITLSIMFWGYFFGAYILLV